MIEWLIDWLIDWLPGGQTAGCLQPPHPSHYPTRLFAPFGFRGCWRDSRELDESFLSNCACTKADDEWQTESTSVSEAQHGTTSGHNTLRSVNRYTHSCRVSRLIFQLPLLLEQLLDCGYVSVTPPPHRETLSIVFRLSVCCDWDSHRQQVGLAQLWHNGR